jgi:putative ABC transport system permease protein
VTATWAAYTALDPDTPADEYRVTLARGADAQAFIKGVEAADPHLHAAVHDSGTTSVTTALVGFATVFSVLLAIVAALGVLNTVLLSIRDRRRDYGMLRSIGMTPGQVVAMTLTSVTGLGLAGALLGIPLGMAAHRLIADHAQVLVFSNAMKDVWHPLQLAGLALAGVAIAVLGALPPARSAARQPIATVLHGE